MRSCRVEYPLPRGTGSKSAYVPLSYIKTFLLLHIYYCPFEKRAIAVPSPVCHYQIVRPAPVEMTSTRVKPKERRKDTTGEKCRHGRT